MTTGPQVTWISGVLTFGNPGQGPKCKTLVPQGLVDNIKLSRVLNSGDLLYLPLPHSGCLSEPV